jgi:divalent metal cation (Fe/Co/Zn/Cd) transporter
MSIVAIAYTVVFGGVAMFLIGIGIFQLRERSIERTIRERYEVIVKSVDDTTWFGLQKVKRDRTGRTYGRSDTSWKIQVPDNSPLLEVELKVAKDRAKQMADVLNS